MDFDFSPVEKVDQVPEQFRVLYSPTAGEDGKFTVADNYKPIADAINGFNKTNKQLRADIKAKAVDLTPLAAYGDNPTAIAEGVARAITEAGATKDKDAAKQVEAAKQGLITAHTKELEKRDARNTALQNQLYGLLVDRDATAAIAELKGVAELLIPFVKQQVRVIEEDGQFKVQVVDAAGEVRYGSTGSPMTIRELITEMKANERYGRLFESEARPGGGKPPGSGNPSQRPNGKTMTANEKIAAGIAKGQHRG